MDGENRKVVIVGGGITGLTAAFYLQKAIKENNLTVDVKLIEASRRLGGKIQTLQRDGFVIERGPESFVAAKNSTLQLVKHLALEEELITSTNGKSYVLVNDKLHTIPGGAVLGIPTRITPFIITNLFSVTGKFRAAADYLIPRSSVANDQSLGGFFRRRLGDEVVENLIEPLLSGIYAGDIDQLSLMSIFPQLYHAEQKYRSLLVGLKRSPELNKKQQNETNAEFLSFKNGLESLVTAIEKKLDPGTVMKGIKVNSISKENSESLYSIILNNGELLKADSVIVTLPHSTLPSVFSEYNYFKSLLDIPTTSVATVAMAFNRPPNFKMMDGNSFVVSRNNDYTITGCTWINNKWPSFAPKEKILIRCYVGKIGDQTVVDLSDGEIEQIVLADLKKAIGFELQPEFSVVTRWKDSIPQYTVGHQERLDQLNEKLKEELPGIFLVGSSFSGMSVPDCIEQGEEVVQKTLDFLR